MAISEAQIFAILVLALLPGILAVWLGSALARS